MVALTGCETFSSGARGSFSQSIVVSAPVPCFKIAMEHV